MRRCPCSTQCQARESLSLSLHLHHSPWTVLSTSPLLPPPPAYAWLQSQTKEFVYRLNRYLDEKANRTPLLRVTQKSEATVKRICSKENKIWELVPHPHLHVFTSPQKKGTKSHQPRLLIVDSFIINTHIYIYDDTSDEDSDSEQE